MRNNRESLRIQMVLSVRFAPLTPEETQLVEAGKGGLLLSNSSSIVPFKLLNATPTSRASDQEALMHHYFQILDAKLNWLIERFADEDKELTGRGETLDIGGDGLCFVTSESLVVGTLLRMKLKLSSTPLPVDFLAEVLRVEPRRTNGSSESSRSSVAVRFIEIWDVQREQIIQYIFGQERQELRRRKENLISQG